METERVGRPDVLVGEFLPEPAVRERSRRAREGLIDAALVRFAANGYEATTVEEIARHAGVAVGGFYLHFRSKRQVLLLLVDRLLLELDSATIDARPDDAASIIECIRGCFNSVWTHAGVYRAWREATLRDASLAALHERIESWTAKRIAEALNAAAAAPGARAGVDVAALSYILSVIFLRMLEALVPDRAGLSETVVAVIRYALFPGGGTEPAGPGPLTRAE